MKREYLMMSETDLMIIECFGPTGAGKTTFALALEARLRSTRLNVFTMLSAQPKEQTFMAAANNNTIAGLMRPINELMNIARLTSRPRSITSQQKLLLRQSFRASIMRRYFKRLSQAWANAAKSNDIWIFDQAYVQAVSSILRVQPHISDDDIIALLALVPRSDLVVCIDTPVEDIKARLKQRRRVYDVTGMVVQEPNIDIPNYGGDRKTTLQAYEQIGSIHNFGRFGE